jgi:hypothetical protein
VAKLFLIEALGEGEEDKMRDIPPEEEDPGEFFLEEFSKISLNPITGTLSPKTMRIVGIVRCHQVIIFIDSGSTHNFLDTKMVATLGIQPTVQDGITVRIANGQEIASLGRSRKVEIKMQGYVYRTDLFILPLAGCDVVLGIQWLQILGPIL